MLLKSRIKLVIRILALLAVFSIFILHLITPAHVHPDINDKDGKYCQCSVEQSSIRYSFENLTMMSRYEVEKIQDIWEEELSKASKHGNSRSAMNETIEGSGEPERVILVSAWNSGSSYVGTILRSRPAAHYFFEPLYNSFSNSLVRTTTDAQKALEIIRNVFHCRDLGRHMCKLNEDKIFFSGNSELFEIAKEHNNRWDPTLVTVMCRRSPFLAMKTVRLKLRHASALLEDEKLNLKMIYLVRDPRATVNSRRNTDWCPFLPECPNITLFCSNLVEDFTVAKDLEREYPSRFMVLQYEDLLTASRTSSTLSQFLNMSADAFTKLTTPERELQLTKWIKDLGNNSDVVRSIQDTCSKAMDLWGYAPIQTLPVNSTAS